ncbi:MAG TPA: ATP-grasp domain-containing protein [Saprospiraceae bacterium]|nr:ATP-grasp domain-containing protein [Saprospiraceae bacterium]
MSEKIRVGIFFGGPSREREISFAGGRTVYDNLDKSLFEAIPIFIDSNRRLIQLDWQYVYKGTIRDFYPPVEFLPPSDNPFQIYIESLGKLDDETYLALCQKVGNPIEWHDIPHLIDIAFLALHGIFGEDGQIQSILESINVPYTGSGVLPCAIGMDKSVQKKLMQDADFVMPTLLEIERSDWKNGKRNFYELAQKNIGFPLVVRPSNQGSSIGVSILIDDDENRFTEAVDKAFFRQVLDLKQWRDKDQDDKIQLVRHLIDIREGLGFPIRVNDKIYYHPDDLLELFNSSREDSLLLEAVYNERKVLIESFIHGKEFSCIVIRNEDGNPVALPPTEIVKNSKFYDYKSKYLPGLSRKITPINLPDAEIQAIRNECQKLFNHFAFTCYARIDGFITDDGKIILNDPNTTSGMMPSSFFFHQAAEIGLDPSKFLTFIIRTSLIERIHESLEITSYDSLLVRLDTLMENAKAAEGNKIKVAVILGGYSFERHISVESGRNIYEKLASSDKYEPSPVFLKKTEDGYEFYKIPISLLLKDNADDISDKIDNFYTHPIIDEIRKECQSVMNRYRYSGELLKPEHLSNQQLKDEFSEVFIALHGRPGEDGTLQEQLAQLDISYNGSPSHSSKITIDKYDTLQLLKSHGFLVADQYILSKEIYNSNQNEAINTIVSRFSFPFIAKPVDDGCSSAVKRIKNRDSLQSYLDVIFRDDETLTKMQRDSVHIGENEEFPSKNRILIESMIDRGSAVDFMEVTVGLMTRYQGEQVIYEVFEPSEALVGGEVLSLEEKFLAGEGQNITPARFGNQKSEYDIVALQVKSELEKAAKILGVEGYARIDAFVRIYEDLRAETIIIEVNSLPGMTPATCIFHQSAIAGLSPYSFIDEILTFGKKRLEKSITT